MIAVDTSVAVAAFGVWHELNERAVEVLDDGAALPAHALLETYSVLTGFPPPHRAPTEVVESWSESRFATILPPPPVEDHRELVRRLAGFGRAGGAVHDGLIAVTARRAGLVLVSADRRAAAVYESLGVPFELI